MNVKAILVAGVALLAAAAWFFFDRDPGAAPQGPAPGAVAADQQAAAAERAGGAAAVPANAAANVGERVEARPEVLPPADARYVVRGRLVGPDGAARAGILLEARTWPTLDGVDFVDLPVRPAAGREQPATVTSAADGSFRFEFARDRSGALDLAAAEVVFEAPVTNFRGGQGDQDLGALTVLRASVLAGVVQDQNGQPVADVKVAAAVGLIGGTSESKTAADGTFSIGKLRPGKWTLRTLSGRFAPTVEDFVLAPEQQRTDLVLVVKPGNTIAGQVVDDRGVGVAGMKVASKRKESRGGVDVERFTADEATTTDAHGFFTLAGLNEEAATIRVFGPGHASLTLPEVQVGTGNLLLRVDRLGAVEGVLVDAGGAAIAGSRVNAVAPRKGLGGATFDEMDFGDLGDGRARATTAADGSFRVENVKPGDVVVAARGDGHRPAQQDGVRVLPGQTIKGVRLVADLGATAKVTVLDDDGKPVAGASVLVRRPQSGDEAPGGMFRARRVAVEDGDGGVAIHGADADVGSGKTNQDGIALVRGLPAGDFEVVATHAEWAKAAAVPIVLPRAGTADATLRLRLPGKVEITVADNEGQPVPGAEVWLTPADGTAAAEPTNRRCDERGRAVLGGLIAGQYTAALARPAKAAAMGDMMISFAGDSPTLASSAQPVTVVAGRTVAVQLRQPLLATIRGIVTGADGPLAAASVALEGEHEPGLDLPGMPGFGGAQRVLTAADGGYVIEGVEAGNYVLRFGTGDQVVKAKQAIVVPPNVRELRQDLQLHVGSLRVLVVAKDSGEPVAGAEIEIEPSVEGDAAPAERRVMMVAMTTFDGSGGPEATTMTLGAQRVRTDAAGQAVIENVPVGTYAIEISHRRYAKASLRQIVVVERQVSDAGRVELTGAGTVRGKVTGSDGKAVGMALVAHRKLGTTDENSEMAMGGSYRIGGLEAGRHEVRAQSVGDGESRFSAWREVEVKAGETVTVDLQLAPQ